MESLTLSEVHHFLLLESRVLVLDPDLATPQFASLEILNERYDDEVHLTDDDVFHFLAVLGTRPLLPNLPCIIV